MKTLKTVYETTDGKLWKDKGQAKRHEAWLDIVALCLTCDASCEVTMAVWLIENSKELASLFRVGPIDGGGLPDDAPTAPCSCGRRLVERGGDLCSLCVEEVAGSDEGD